MNTSRKYTVLGTSLVLALLLWGAWGCTKKMSGVNNNQVIETPYTLFFADSAGGLYKTNDAKTVQTLFKADGFPSKAICVSGTNLLWVKNVSIYISTNNGVNFNHTFDSAGYYPSAACNGFPLDLNQSMALDVPAWNRVYFVSTEGPATNNYMGVRYSLYDGAPGTWYTDGRPDTNGAAGQYGSAPYTISITSLTQLTNGVLCGYDTWNNRNFYKTPDILWKETTANPDSASSSFSGYSGIGNRSLWAGVCLPHNTTRAATIDTSARYSIGHYNNRLIAIDNKNCNGNGAYYSDDTGRNWAQYQGLPKKPLLCIASPFEEVCLIGTDSAGLYMLNNNTGLWQPNNNGLGSGLIVRNIAFKQNTYKDGSILKYVFLATNKGIYMSTDVGANWTLAIPGNFINVY